MQFNHPANASFVCFSQQKSLCAEKQSPMGPYGLCYFCILNSGPARNWTEKALDQVARTFLQYQSSSLK